MRGGLQAWMTTERAMAVKMMQTEKVYMMKKAGPTAWKSRPSEVSGSARSISRMFMSDGLRVITTRLAMVRGMVDHCGAVEPKAMCAKKPKARMQMKMRESAGMSAVMQRRMALRSRKKRVEKSE